MNVREAIDAGDVAALARLVAEDPSRRDALIRWGDGNECHPLHYICDKVFDGTLKSGAAELARVFLDAGADINFENGDPLNTAVSLGATEVAVLLLDAGARPDLIGLLGETALHWAAFTGSEIVVARLLEAGTPVNVRDARWNGTPVGWALHGWSQSPVPADQGGHRACVLRLARAGSIADPQWLDSELVRADDEVLRALQPQ